MAYFAPKVFHQEPYPAIEASKFAATQDGRTVLITGAAEGIGLATARSFLLAGASTLIMTGRRHSALETAKADLEHSAQSVNSKAAIITIASDAGSKADVIDLWTQLSDQNISIDTLILNAAERYPRGSILEQSEDEIRNIFEVNYHGSLAMVKRFYAQGKAQGKLLINVSSAVAHTSGPWAVRTAYYGTSKAAFAMLMQDLAYEIAESKMRIVNVHPGVVFTGASVREGANEKTLPWDKVTLPAHFMLWLTTDKAAFLHGRFVWTNWDVEELIVAKDDILKHDGCLRLGLQGSTMISTQGLYANIGKALQAGQKGALDIEYC